MKNQDAVFGFVKFFRPNREDPDRSFGFATTDGGDVYFQMWMCRKIVAGPEGPDFSAENWNQWPSQGDRVVLLLDNRPLRNSGAPSAWRWGYRHFWDIARREIENRPLYQVRGENRFKGQKMNGNVREEVIIDCATMEELQAKYPRGIENDFLGTEEPYRSGPCQRINKWYKWSQTEWQKCADPRPVPEMELAERLQGFVEKVVADLMAEQPSDKAELEVLAASIGGRNRGVENTKRFRRAVAA